MGRVLGFVEYQNECECCGKKGLKGTYLVVNENNEEIYMGSSCVLKKHNHYKKVSDIKEAIDEKINEIILNARNEYKLLGGKELEKKLYDLEFLSDEYLEIENKIKDIKNILCDKYSEKYYKLIPLKII